MGQSWDRARYRAVVAACALQPDIELLAAGAVLSPTAVLTLELNAGHPVPVPVLGHACSRVSC